MSLPRFSAELIPSWSGGGGAPGSKRAWGGVRFLVVAGLLAIAGSPPAFAEAVRPAAAAPGAAPQERLPAARTTRHELSLGDRLLAFAATAGAITLKGARDREEADIAFIAYELDGADPASRPVTFVVNGGPGASSAYLQIGALGPWFLPMEGKPIVPSQSVKVVANPDTWLDFTDLVFVDPVGTGFSRLVDPDDTSRDRYLSIEGDVEALSDFILRWLIESDRVQSPKYFVGESYGAFRGPLIAESLQTDHGVALDGMTLLSPVLDFGWWQQPEYAPLPMVSLLPSLAATQMEALGTFSEEGLRAAEDYAAGDYVTDLLRGVADETAVARLVDRVTALTGLDRQVVARSEGRIDSYDFTREILRDERRRASVYDATVTTDSPRGPDPVLDAVTAPLTSAMLVHYRDTLGWLPNRRYVLLNREVSRSWDWGSGRGQPEVVGTLEDVLSLDHEFRLLVAHGYTDLVTPYFGSALILRQLEVSDADGRVRQENYRGGHMFYLREESAGRFGKTQWRCTWGGKGEARPDDGLRQLTSGPLASSSRSSPERYPVRILPDAKAGVLSEVRAIRERQRRRMLPRRPGAAGRCEDWLEVGHSYLHWLQDRRHPATGRRGPISRYAAVALRDQ